MATKKSMWVLIGFFISAAWLLGIVIEAQAESMKCKVAAVYVKSEEIPVIELDGCVLGLHTREGLAFFENGEIANFKNHMITDNVLGKGGHSYAYSIFTFGDGSKIITKITAQNTAGPDGAVLSKSTSEIMKGTGRFEGIRGTTSSNVRTTPQVGKGEFRKSTSEVIFNYTLPPK